MKSFLTIFIITEAINAKMLIDIFADCTNPTVNISGIETQKITHRDMRNLFFIDRETIEEYTSAYFNNTRPRKVLYSATAKRNDLTTENTQNNEDTGGVNEINQSDSDKDTQDSTSVYKRFNWNPVTLVTSIKTTRIKEVKEGKTLRYEKSFNNPTNETKTVNAGIQTPIAITLETSWHTKPIDILLDYDFVYDINVNFNEDSGTTGLKHTTTFGTPTRIHRLVNIGWKNREVVLQPGQSVIAKFSAKVCNLALRVAFLAAVKGNLAVNFKEVVNGKHWWGPKIEDVLMKANLTSESPIEENLVIRLDFYHDVKVEIIDKKTGQLV